MTELNISDILIDDLPSVKPITQEKTDNLPVTPKKPTRNNRYDPKVWARVKVDWESGKYTTRSLSTKYKMPQSTVSQKINAQNWTKGATIEKLAGTIAERNMEYFARAGIAKQDAIDLIVEGMTKPEVVKFEGKGDNMLATSVPDYKTRLEFFKEYNKMVGNYAPMEKEADKHLHFHVSEQQLKEMNASDKINYYQQMQDQ